MEIKPCPIKYDYIDDISLFLLTTMVQIHLRNTHLKLKMKYAFHEVFHHASAPV